MEGFSIAGEERRRPSRHAQRAHYRDKPWELGAPRSCTDKACLVPHMRSEVRAPNSCSPVLAVLHNSPDLRLLGQLVGGPRVGSTPPNTHHPTRTLEAHLGTDW